MSTLTLGIVVIIYMFILAWLGYIGYKQTKNASDYLLGGRKGVINRRDVNLEHERIVDAIEAGNPKLARKLLVEHIAHARKLMRKLVRK